MLLCFFFSSRRRHTRCSRDWSSDVCSSDLSQSFAHEYQYVHNLIEIPSDVILPVEALDGSIGHSKMVAIFAYAIDRKSTRLNSSHGYISYAVFCLKKKKKTRTITSIARLMT